MYVMIYILNDEQVAPFSTKQQWSCHSVVILALYMANKNI